MKRILFVCTGNVCRSPMAAALFERLSVEMGERDLFDVSSAGTWALEGQRASGQAEITMARRGIDITHHRAHTIQMQEVESADLILVMALNHREALSAEMPGCRAKIRLLSELNGKVSDIADPYGGPASEYETTATEIARLLSLGYGLIKEWAGIKSQSAVSN